MELIQCAQRLRPMRPKDSTIRRRAAGSSREALHSPSQGSGSRRCGRQLLSD